MNSLNGTPRKEERERSIAFPGSMPPMNAEMIAADLASWLVSMRESHLRTRLRLAAVSESAQRRSRTLVTSDVAISVGVLDSVTLGSGLATSASGSAYAPGGRHGAGMRGGSGGGLAELLGAAASDSGS
eukprot:1608664-Prymnesium_polylepis.1